MYLSPETDTHVANALDYNKRNAADFLAQLREFLRIPSVSTQPEHDDDVRSAANWLAQNMRQAGLENVRLYPTMGHPIVYGEWLHAEEQPTVLFYGHYDVQPADDVEQWKSPPFDPQIRKDNIYARGASDDKGQVLLLVKAVEAYLQAEGRLPVNVKFAIEGEEETGSENLLKFIEPHRDLLSCDVAYVADTAMVDFGRPAIVYGLRGSAAVNIDVYGPRLDLHSGSYGGAINNPINALVHILATLKNADGYITIPGFYDKVQQLDADERQRLAAYSVDEQSWLDWTGAPAIWGEPQFSLAERLGARPTLDINGIVGGYSGKGAKTIIPSHAHAKITMRLVPEQNPDDIIGLLIDHVKRVAPPSVRVECHVHGSGPSSISDTSHPAMHAAIEACERVYGVPPVFKREGGSIPVVARLQSALDAAVIMLGFGLPHDRLHAPNERFYLPNFYSGIETVIHFLTAYSRIG